MNLKVLAATGLIVLAATCGFGQSGSLPTYGFSALPPLLPRVAGVSRYALIGDFNGDELPDIANLDDRGTLITVFLGDGSGNFGSPAKTTVTPGVRAIALADFNKDGKADLVTWTMVAGASPNGRIVIFLSNGDGTFSQKATYTGPDNSTRNGGFPGVISDLNGDTYPDIALVNVPAQTIDVMLGNRDGTLLPAHSYATRQQDFALALAGDVDGDGVMDLIAVSRVVGKSAGDIRVLRGIPGGAFGEPTDALSGTPSLPNQEVGIAAYSDLNSDHKGDLVLANVGQTNVSIYLMKGDGTFVLSNVSPSLKTVSPVYPFEIVIADMTADGKPDLVISNSLARETLNVFPGRGDGTFDSPAAYMDPGNYGAPSVATSLAVGDLNRDGRIDIVITQFGLLSLLMGVPAPFLRIQVTHNGDFLLRQNDAAFTVEASNPGNALITTGRVTVRFVELDSYGITSIAGQGWDCTGMEGPACWRDDALPPGASYPPIIIRVNLDSVRGGIPIRLATAVSGGGSAQTALTDAKNVLTYQAYCLYGLDGPRTVSAGVDGAQINYAVAASPSCGVNVQISDPWITTSFGAIIVAPNTTGSRRTATINFVSPSGWRDSVLVDQASSPGCAYQLWPTSLTAGPSGLASLVRVLTATRCTWTATSNAPWITFPVFASGDGLTPFYIKVEPNLTGVNRFGTATVNGQTFTVFQTASENPTVLGSLPHFAMGGGWEELDRTCKYKQRPCPDLTSLL